MTEFFFDFLKFLVGISIAWFVFWLFTQSLKINRSVQNRLCSEIGGKSAGDRVKTVFFGRISSDDAMFVHSAVIKKNDQNDIVVEKRRQISQNTLDAVFDR